MRGDVDVRGRGPRVTRAVAVGTRTGRARPQSRAVADLNAPLRPSTRTVIQRLTTGGRAAARSPTRQEQSGGLAKSVLLQLLRYVTNEVVGHLTLSAIRHAWYRGVLGIGLGPGAVVLMHVTISFFGLPAAGRERGIVIGRRTVIGRECWLDARGGLRIGDDVSMNRGVWLIAGDHDPNDPQFGTRFAPIVVGDRAFFGSRAMVLKGVTIGEGAVVAAGAVVTRDVAPYAIVAGNPARVVGERARDLRYQLRYFPELE